MIFKLTSEEEALYARKGNHKLLLNHALFVLNFLFCDEQGQTAAYHPWHPTTASAYAQVLWKDPLSSQWWSPDPVLIWGKRHACIYDSQVENARWLPNRLVKPYSSPRDGVLENPG